MPFDAHKNLAIGTIYIQPTPPASGVYLFVNPGDGARFPTPPFNATVWPANEPPTPVNAEILRVTGIDGDGFNIVRAQEGSTARAIAPGDLLAATITAKVITDIESGVNFPALASSGNIHEKGRAVALGHWISHPYAAGDYTGTAGAWTVEAGDVISNRYAVIGQTLVWQVWLQASSLAVAGGIKVRLPGGHAAGGPGFGIGKAYDGTTWQLVTLSVPGAPADYVDIQRLDFSNWPATTNGLHVQFLITCEVSTLPRNETTPADPLEPAE
jgi:hypothetical protein